MLAGVAVLASGCGAGGDRDAVERLIEEDWNAAEAGDARWPGRPDLEGTTVAAVRCPSGAEGGRVVCTVRLDPGAPATELTVVADVDETGAVRRWRLEG